jgi:hypothetical protein
MSTGGTTTGERLPRRGRYLIPGTIPRRAEFVAALGVLLVLAHLVFAQLTIVFAIVFYTITKITRWRPQWLAVPAAVGVVWALAIGPATAAAGLLAGPRHIVAYLGGVSAAPARVMHLGAAFGGMGEWLPPQFPLALVTGAAEAAIAVWLSWLHTDEWRLPTPRPGAVIAIRRWYLARLVRSGGVVTRDGACLGIAAPGGGRAALSWDEVAPGVLCTGAGGSGITSTSFQLVHAAIRRRKPVIAVDLSGSRQLAEWFAIVCGATGTPLQVFAATGPAYYEPLRGGDPGRRAALVMGMIDWAGTADQYRRSCGAYLNDLFAVTDAAPGDPRTPMLDEVLHLLSPAALRARAQHVPRFHPHREALIERVKVSASLFEADPQTVATLVGQLTALRSCALGRWLAPPPPADAARVAVSSRVHLGRAIRQRAVVLFSLDGDSRGRPASAVASLVAQDVIAICAELRRIGVEGDGLIWFEHCGEVPIGVLTELISRGAAAGLPAVLTTSSAQAAEKLADHANAVVIHRMTDPVMAERFARIAGEKLVPSEAVDLQVPGHAVAAQAWPGSVALGSEPRVSGRGIPPAGDPPDTAAPGFGSVAFGAPGLGAPGLGAPGSSARGGGVPGDSATGGPFLPAGSTFVRRPVVSPETLCGLGNGRFVLLVKGPRRRLVPLGRTVRARLHAPSRRRGRKPTATTVSRRPARGAAANAPAHARQPFGSDGGQAGQVGDFGAEHGPERTHTPAGAGLADDHGLPRREPRRGNRRHQGTADGPHPAPVGSAGPHGSGLTGAVPGESPEQRWPT